MIKCTLDYIFDKLELWLTENPKEIIFWTIGILVAYRIIMGLYYGIIISKMKKKNKEAIKLRLEEREKSFKYNFEISKILSPELQKQIFDADIEKLQSLLGSGKLTSEQLIKFYYMRTKTRGLDMNAVTDSNIEEALKLAKKADLKIKKQGQKIFETEPLLGIPFSVKESIAMEGFSNTQGFPTRAQAKEDFTCDVILTLKKKGGIPFVRTTIPQALMAFESKNEIYGQALNPHSKERTPGGSSGGEGALVGGGCSPFGIGSDIGGSVRIPVAFCGIYGFKATPYRISFVGHPSVTPLKGNHSHQTYILPTLGPLCKSMKDVKILMGIMGDVACGNHHNSSIPPMRWRNEIAELRPPKKEVRVNGKRLKKTKIGYFTEIKGLIRSSKKMKECVMKTVDVLEKAGYETEEIEIEKGVEMIKLCFRIFFLDGNNNDFFQKHKHGIEVEHFYKDLKIFYKMPKFVKNILIKIAGFAVSKRVAMVLDTTTPAPIEELFKIGSEHLKYCYEFLDDLKSKGITHLVSPSFATPAYTHGATEKGTLGAVFTIIYNFLGMPAGTLPVMKLEEDDEIEDFVDDIVTDSLKEVCKGSKGMPVGVQIAGFPYEDESVVGLMSEVERLMGLKALIKT